MLGTPIIIKRSSKGEAEKPFWISYADLMTALMVLFLVVMSVALLAVTKTVTEIERQKAEREQEIAKLLDAVESAAVRYPGVTVDRNQNIIDFGDQAYFEKGKHTLMPEQVRFLRKFIPDILVIARSDLGKKWLKRFVVEGFASPEGDYLYNLNLSLQRSQRVLCVLLSPPYPDEPAMSEADREQVRDQFLVGGYSFNATKYDEALHSYEKSRRVSIRLEFLSIGEPRVSTGVAPPGDFGRCALGA